MTPPAVQLGDMVVMVATYRGTATLTLAETGGQAWTAEANTQANGVTVRVFWSQFNGTWTANPAVTNTTGTEPLTVYSFAVDLAPGTYPEIDVPFLSGNHSGGTVTVPSFSTNTPGALALVGWISIDNNTWGAPTTGWSSPGSQSQWRNGNGSDNSIALAFRNLASAGATGSIARAQTASGPDNGLYFRMAFKATQLTPATPPSDPANLLASASIGQVELTWEDTATNEFAFQIERCTNAGCTNFAPLTGVGANVTSYRDTTVAATTIYRYRVRANNVFGPSQYTTSADVTTPTPAFAFRGVGTHFPTVENADQGGGPGPRAITPPASLQPGDLMVIVAAYRGTATLTLSETGGQVWTSETNAQANGQTVRVFWSQFNGFWTANPAVTNTTGTLPLTVYSFAFDMAPGLYPVIDVPFVSGSHAGGTVTVPSFDTNTTGVLALAGWISGDNNTWGAVTTGWSTPGGQAQWRNSNGSDSSIAFAYRLLGPGRAVREHRSHPERERTRQRPLFPAGFPRAGNSIRSSGRSVGPAGSGIGRTSSADLARPRDERSRIQHRAVCRRELHELCRARRGRTERDELQRHHQRGRFDDVSVSGTGIQSLQSVELLEYRRRRNARAAAATSRPVHVPIGRHSLSDCGQHEWHGSGTARRDTSSDAASRRLVRHRGGLSRER